MAVCSRYTNQQEDAAEILNDGFLKVFKEIYRFTPAYADVASSFKGWLRKIMIYTAIDYNRKFNKYEMSAVYGATIIELAGIQETVLDKISYDEIIKAIQNLSPAYRTVLNLYIIEGFSHNEIAEKLGISVGTSKSNLSKARIQLQKILINSPQTILQKNEA